jgi:hypothetical protein
MKSDFDRFEAQNLAISCFLLTDGRIAANNVSFKWEVRGKEIWLRTNLGGVILGKIIGEAIEIDLPVAGRPKL